MRLLLPCAPLVGALLACSERLVTPAGEPTTTTPADEVLPSWPGDSESDPLPAVYINEVMSANRSTVMDSSGQLSDWLELYNASDAPVALARLGLADADGVALNLGEGEIAPHSHLLLWADGESLPFQLDADGDQLVLYIDGVPADHLALGALPADVAWGRYPDGQDWDLSIRPTPGYTNGSFAPTSTDPSDTIFQTDTINDVFLTLSAQDEASLRASPYTEVAVGLFFEGVWLEPVNLRIKAYVGSARSYDQKSAFKVDLDDYADLELRGLEKLTFNNMVQDQTYIHEYLAYRLFREVGIPAPRTSYTRLYINDELRGLYLWIESIDERFLSRWYADPSGNLYEGAYGVDFYSGYEGSFECDQCADPNDRSDLSAVIAVLESGSSDASVAAFEQLFNLDSFLRMMAVEAIIWHWDGYTTSNNYRVYNDPTTGRFEMIPWGTDQTFVDEWYGPWDARGRIFSWCLQNAGCAERYEAALLEVADIMESLPLEAEMDTLLGWLAADITADPRREFDLSYLDSRVEDTRANIQGGPDRIRAAVAAH